MEKKESRELSYKLAVKLLDLMLKNGFLLPEEYEKIDALNRNFPKYMLKALDIQQKLWYCVVLIGEVILKRVYLKMEEKESDGKKGKESHTD